MDSVSGLYHGLTDVKGLRGTGDLKTKILYADSAVSSSDLGETLR